MRFRARVLQSIAGCLVFAMFVTGCGPTKSLGNATLLPEASAKTMTLEEFDQKLSQVSDQQSAEEAVDAFLGYVATRFEESKQGDAAALQSSLSNKEFIKNKARFSQLAQSELQTRQKRASLQSEESGDSTQNDHVVSLASVLEQINKQYPTLGAQIGDLAAVQAGLRATMPHLAVDPESTHMSPLEANMLTWVYLTGDDGSMPAGAMGSLDREAPVFTETRVQFLEFIIIVLIVVAVACGTSNLRAQMESKDLFGNTIHKDEQYEFCWKEKKGKRTVTRTRTETRRTHYYTHQNLEDVANELSKDIEIVYSGSSSGLARYVRTTPVSIASASGSARLQSSSSPTYSNADFITFPYTNYRGVIRKGDLIFKKSTRRDIVSKFSFLTHVAIFYDHPVNQFPRVYEAVMKGADTYQLGENWGEDLLFSLRRIGNAPTATVAQAVDNSLSRYRGAKFRPDVPTNRNADPDALPLLDKIAYYREWSDKNKSTGIYCSKLVWLTFKDGRNNAGKLIDLDSNTTRVTGVQWPVLTFPDKNNDGWVISNAFVGVSPDDIFESRHLDSGFIHETVSPALKR